MAQITHTRLIRQVGVHAAVLVLFGYYSSSLWKAYSLWYIVGTAGAIQVPVVGMSPFRSMEQIGPLAVFGVMQVGGLPVCVCVCVCVCV